MAFAAIAEVDGLTGAGGRTGGSQRPAFTDRRADDDLHGRPGPRVPAPMSGHSDDLRGAVTLVRSLGHVSSVLRASRHRAISSWRSSGGSVRPARAARRTVLRSCSDRYSDRGETVDAGERQRRHERRRASFQPCRFLPRDPVVVSEDQLGGGGEELVAVVRVPCRLQQQVVDAEREIERRIAGAGALGVEQHRAVRADEDVLRADVAVDHGDVARRQRRGHVEQLRRDARVLGGGDAQVRPEPQLFEQRSRRGEAAAMGDERGVQLGEAPASLGGDGSVDVPGGELLLPHRVDGGVEPGQHDRVVVVVGGEQRARRAGDEVLGQAEPAGFPGANAPSAPATSPPPRALGALA